MAIFFLGPRVVLTQPLSCPGHIDRVEALGVSIYVRSGAASSEQDACRIFNSYLNRVKLKQLFLYHVRDDFNSFWDVDVLEIERRMFKVRGFLFIVILKALTFRL